MDISSWKIKQDGIKKCLHHRWMTLEIFVEPHILPSAWQNKKEPYRLEEQPRYFKLNKKSCSWWSCVYYIATKVQRSWFKEINRDIWISKFQRRFKLFSFNITLFDISDRKMLETYKKLTLNFYKDKKHI